MSPEKQRIAIAEACGWRCWHHEETVDFAMFPPGCSLHGLWIKGKPSDDAELSRAYSPPDYLNDLNAMHEAEKILSDVPDNSPSGTGFSQQEEYVGKLEIVAGSALGFFPEVHAPASQRAEAFLRTIGKWEGGTDGK